MKIKSLKPTEIDSHFKYICPKCGCSHWLSLKETQTKGFRVVCDCSTVFKPRNIEKISVLYSSKTKNKISSGLDIKILNQGVDLLAQYGFDSIEAKSLITKAYEDIKNTNITELIKHSLKIFGEQKL